MAINYLTNGGAAQAAQNTLTNMRAIHPITPLSPSTVTQPTMAPSMDAGSFVPVQRAMPVAKPVAIAPTTAITPAPMAQGGLLGNAGPARNALANWRASMPSRASFATAGDFVNALQQWRMSRPAMGYSGNIL